MKNIKRIAAISLAVMLAVVFAGCGIAKKPSGGNAGGGSPIPAPQSDSIEGTYYSSFDMSGIVAAQIQEEYDIDASYPLYMDLTMTLNADDTYRIEFDLTSFLDNTKEYYYQIFPEMLKAIFAEQGLSESQIEPTIQSQGYSSTQEYLDEMVNEAMASVESEYADGNNTVTEGTYKVDESAGTIELFEDGYSTATDTGVINDDGSITIQNISLEGESVDIVFSK